MPQMGESIFEGTITKWLKKVGDKVQRDEPLFEISTDKVDAEIPAPAAGVLREIKVKEGTTVQVNTVVAVIGGAGAPAQAAAAKPQASQPQAAQSPAAVTALNSQRNSSNLSRNRLSASRLGITGRMANACARHRWCAAWRVKTMSISTWSRVPAWADASARPISRTLSSSTALAEAGRRWFPRRHRDQHSSPRSNRHRLTQTRPSAPPEIQTVPGEVVPMTPMRKKIAERMVESKHTSAHVHSVFKVDMTRIARFREKNRKAWEARNGVKLTYLPFIAKALLHGIRVKPIMNSSVVGDGIQYHKNVNIGIAVALDWGLIVPVVKGAENLSFVGLQRAIVDLGERARTKKLKPDDVQSGTITITNPGIYGPQFGLPIILQPQVAILGMGGIFKEPVVVTDEDGNDSIAVRHIIRLSVGYDHRIIDGADADQFMVAVREYLENFNEDIG